MRIIKRIVFTLAIVIGLVKPVYGKTCTATYAKWNDWTVSSDGNFNLWDDLQFGQSNGKGSAGLPPFLGDALSSSFMGRSGNKTYYFSYHATNPTIEYLDNWGGQERLFYLVDYVYIRYPKGSSIPSSPSRYGFVSSTCPVDDDDDNDDDDDGDDGDDDDDDDCCGLGCIPGLISLFSDRAGDYDYTWLIPYLPSCDEEECPNLNLRITGTLLPARQGTARISGDWCKSLDCGNGTLYK